MQIVINWLVVLDLLSFYEVTCSGINHRFGFNERELNKEKKGQTVRHKRPAVIQP